VLLDQERGHQSLLQGREQMQAEIVASADKSVSWKAPDIIGDTSQERNLGAKRGSTRNKSAWTAE
jgi:hypothetical protein